MDATKEKVPIDSNIDIDDVQLGLWRLKVANNPGWNLRRHFDNITSTYPSLRRLCGEIFSLSPRTFIFFLVCQVWGGIEDAVLMHISSSLLRMIEIGIVSGNPNTSGIIWTISIWLACAVFAGWIAWHSEENRASLRSQIQNNFNLHLMKARLQIDLPTAQEALSGQDVNADDASTALEGIMYFLTGLLITVSNLALMMHLLHTTGGPIFALLCISKPIISVTCTRNLWDKVCFGVIENLYHRRLKALEKFANGEFRQDIISGNLGEWIVEEYQKARSQIGEFIDEHPFTTYRRRPTPRFDMFDRVLNDLPMIYCALNVIFYPSKFSIASIAILQQSSTAVRFSLEAVLQRNQNFKKSIANIKKFYEASEVVSTIQEGVVAYPQVEEKGEWNSDKGMSFEIKNLSFSYPGSQKTSSALTNISLEIKAGQLVVIVGANGSGKSTLVRILARLYDPTSGQLIIDGRQFSEYRVKDLHRATAVLSQDNLIYPLTLAENIALGYPDCSSNMEMIKEAAEDGGASEFVGKLKNGIQTSLDPHIETLQHGLHRNKTHPLYKEVEKVERKIDISGGEKQRIVAARSFMRFKSGKIKFVAVDEPSSALDADAELQLFKRLIGVREGKTMVLVTHRFGHLTKHADQIICLKDGKITETGTHETLMGINGEYAKLYEIQDLYFEWQTVVLFRSLLVCACRTMMRLLESIR